MDSDADPGGPKTYGSYGSGSATLLCASRKGSHHYIPAGANLTSCHEPHKTNNPYRYLGLGDELPVVLRSLAGKGLGHQLGGVGWSLQEDELLLEPRHMLCRGGAPGSRLIQLPAYVHQLVYCEQKIDSSSRVADPDPHWIRIRIQEDDPQK